MRLLLFLTLTVWLSTGCKPGGFGTAESVVEKYLESPRWEERLKWVRNPEVVRPYMAGHYSDDALPAKFLRVEKARPLVDMDGWVTVRAVMAKRKDQSGNEAEEANVYAVLKTTEGWKIDWESGVGFNPMSWAEFKATKPPKPQQFRMVARLIDHYPAEFHEAVRHNHVKHDYWSVEISENAGSGMSRSTLLTGYVRKETEDGRKLFSIIRDGGRHAVTCLVRCPNAGDSDEVLFYNNPLSGIIIDKVLADGWLVE